MTSSSSRTTASNESQGPSIWSRVTSAARNAVFEEDDSHDDSDSDEVHAAPVPQVPTTVRPVTAPVQEPQVDPRIREVLEAACDHVAPPAFSVLRTTLASLQAVPGMTEDVRIQAAIATCSGQGLDPASILWDIDECLQALQTNEADAASQAAQALEQEVGGREAQVEDLTRQIAELEEQRRQLTQQRDETSTQIGAARSDIESMQRSFNATAGQMGRELKHIRAAVERLTGVSEAVDNGVRHD